VSYFWGRGLKCRPLPQTPSPARRCKNALMKAEAVSKKTAALSRDVTGTGAALLDLPKRSFRMAANYRRISRFGVFRRWIKDHASLRG